MKGFLRETAESLYAKYGDDISSLFVLLPSRRSRLFFSEALSSIASKPLWQPRFVTVDELMEKYAGIRTGDHIRLVTELYKVYSKYHEEDFDSFWFWGEMLLADFDTIDKYLIDAKMLFRNVSDLRTFDSDLSYLEPSQREVISRFWKTLGKESDYSDEKRRFAAIWNTLWPIYSGLREGLRSEGSTYTGMVHRTAAENIAAGEVPDEPKERFIIVGFNALSACERKLFDYLSVNHDVMFYWDRDDYYMSDRNHEAGMFIRENLARYPQGDPLPSGNAHFVSKKNIRVVSAPSDSLQCKYVGEFLSEIYSRTGTVPDKETAIVLTDESLLVPLLHSIPDFQQKINVTMGYPLRLTPAYSLVERLLQLQSRKRVRSGEVQFHHSDVTGLLTHPYISRLSSGLSASLAAEIVKEQRVYVGADRLHDSEFGKLFASVPDDWRQLADYIMDVAASIVSANGSLPTDERQSEEFSRRYGYFSLIAESMAKLRNSVEACGVEFTVKVFSTLLRRVLQGLRIPYEGEPLEGVQVMGILETRNLDFENVLVLSVNDDTFPGNRAASSSFIPHNLRLAYGLPTPAHHEGVYAYYFYRLLQRAGNIRLVYSSRSDEKMTGEQSRYIYQLQYESPHDVEFVNIGLDVNLPSQRKLSAAAVDRSALDDFTREGGRALSPTSILNYIQCPLKFYFHSILRLRRENTVNEEIDSPLFGTILHRAVEMLYRPLEGKGDPADYLRSVKGSQTVTDVVRLAIDEEYFRGSRRGELEGNLLLISDIVVKYINNCVLDFDLRDGGFTVRNVEFDLGCVFPLRRADGNSVGVNLTGKADRLDILADGIIRVVDYKTGAGKVAFDDIASLVGKGEGKPNPAAFQTLMYAMMMNIKTGCRVQPSVYYVRMLNKADYDPLLAMGPAKERIWDYAMVKESFEQAFADLLGEIFDPTTEFLQCEETSRCQWCDFRDICSR